MELKHHKTEPSTRSTLKFTDNEVILALRAYAFAHGYRSSGLADEYFVSFIRHTYNEKYTVLTADCIGEEYGMLKDEREQSK